MGEHRTVPLALGRNRGQLIVPDTVAAETLASLRRFRGKDGPHEGLVFWLGRRVSGGVLVAGAVVPQCSHAPFSVMVAPADIGEVVRRARRVNLGIVAQVHSHPGNETSHTDGDDLLVLMPFEGMYSIVVGRYGYGGITPDKGSGIHEFQEGRWVRVVREAVDAMVLIPTVVEVE